jgi:pimeloyl-ACP methyl ester carboxylesterase
MRERAYFVYVMSSLPRTLYTGVTNDLERRVAEHKDDQRGSGLSEKPNMDYTIAMLADDTAALMEHVGFFGAHIIGVSMGGTIAQEFAVRHPRKVRSLVLGCTTAGGPNAIRIGGNAFANAYSTKTMTAEERGRAFLAEAAFTKDISRNIRKLSRQ